MNPSCAPLNIFRFLLDKCLDDFSDGGLLDANGVDLLNNLKIT